MYTTATILLKCRCAHMMHLATSTANLNSLPDISTDKHAHVYVGVLPETSA